MILILRDANSTISFLIIKIIVANYKMFDIKTLKKNFIPLLLKKMSLCNDFVDNWVLAHFSTVIQFLITLNISEELCGENIKEFNFVVFNNNLEGDFNRKY